MVMPPTVTLAEEKSMKPLVELPEYITTQIIDLEAAEKFWRSLWINYIRNKGSTSLVYWSEIYANPMEFNKLLILLADYVTCITVPERNWSEASLNEDKLLELFSEEQLIAYREEFKFYQYLPANEVSACSNQVKVNGKVKTTGLDRVGFAKAANTKYSYDSKYLNKHKDSVIREVNKGMTKVREIYKELDNSAASYDAISTSIVEHIAAKPRVYTQGESYIDSRGRAIKGSLSKVANPIGNKVFRSLVVIP